MKLKTIMISMLLVPTLVCAKTDKFKGKGKGQNKNTGTVTEKPVISETRVSSIQSTAYFDVLKHEKSRVLNIIPQNPFEIRCVYGSCRAEDLQYNINFIYRF